MQYLLKRRNMPDTASLREQIGRDIFDYQSVMDCLAPMKKPRDRIRRMIVAGDIIRIRKGLYLFADRFRREPVSRELLANLIHGPSYVSLEYALSHHGLIPERVETVTSVCTGRSRRFATPLGTFLYRSLPMRRYSCGAELYDGPAGSFLMATPAKALVDTVWADKRLESSRLSDLDAFLCEDLRIDREQLKAIPVDEVMEAAAAYRSPKIDRLVASLVRLKEHSDA